MASNIRQLLNAGKCRIECPFLDLFIESVLKFTGNPDDIIFATELFSHYTNFALSDITPGDKQTLKMVTKARFYKVRKYKFYYHIQCIYILRAYLHFPHHEYLFFENSVIIIIHFRFVEKTVDDQARYFKVIMSRNYVPLIRILTLMFHYF